MEEKTIVPLIGQIQEVLERAKSSDPSLKPVKSVVYQSKTDSSVSFTTIEEAFKAGANLANFEQVEVLVDPQKILRKSITGLNSLTKKQSIIIAEFAELAKKLIRDEKADFNKRINQANAKINKENDPVKKLAIRVERVRLYLEYDKKPTRLSEEDMKLYNEEKAKAAN